MKRNKFKRALHHLNKKNVVESAPTNNTLGVFSVTPSGVGPVAVSYTHLRAHET